ncbi:proline racemase family protein [Thalassospira sp. TSL5-1]|uniref:proline racemase family protein n=1 Tax=Thalassospira sp. TSL5-1 TaxID=1544451 RepID=UPI00116128B9
MPPDRGDRHSDRWQIFEPRECPTVSGADILAKRRHVREHLDHLRQFVMLKPRGHTEQICMVSCRLSPACGY